MRKAYLSYTLSILLGTTFLALAFSGINIGFVIPNDIDASWGVSHGWWTRIHLYLALAFIGFVVVHFAFNWDWLSLTSRQSALRSMTVWSLMVVVVATLSVFIGLKAAPESLRVSPEFSLGRRLYLAHGCDACHTIKGAGGSIGPDLSRVGSSQQRDWLKQEIVNPSSHQPNSVMPAYKMPQDELDALVDYLTTLK